jgi:rfaE bifunctional protein nucleotidyltransferase chain/domain
MTIQESKLQALEIIRSKICNRHELLRKRAVCHFKDQTVVFTNGCFDILHQGHIHYLAKAADLGNYLVVGLNSDASVKRLGKSAARPLQDEKSRALILASLHFIDAVVIFDEDTPEELITELKPEVLVKGADYDATERNVKSKKFIVGSDAVKANGGKVETIEYLENFSTTSIEEKIALLQKKV